MRNLLMMHYRLHTQFEIFRSTISRVDVTGSKPKGEADELAVLARTVEADQCYLMDRGYVKFTLLNDIHAGTAATSAEFATTLFTKSSKRSN